MHFITKNIIKEQRTTLLRIAAQTTIKILRFLKIMILLEIWFAIENNVNLELRLAYRNENTKLPDISVPELVNWNMSN